MTFLNIASRLTEMAQRYPEQPAIAEPDGYGFYKTITFAELETDTNLIAAALLENGIQPGMKLALFVRYGIDFISLVFALCKAGVTLILIDPGMGIPRMLHCLAEVEPDGFVAVPSVHWARLFLKHRFPKAKYHLTVGHRWFWGGLSLDAIRNNKNADSCCNNFKITETAPDHLAAIIFTSGSTGLPKGVAFTHCVFDTQVAEISKRYQIQPGEIDLACFPFFGLFDAAMGVTAIIPDMNPAHPAQVNPAKIVQAANSWKITQSFASPALWNRVADYCAKTGKRLETLRRAVSAGAPVSAAILEKLKRCIHPEGEIFTPYGATEALPAASISATEILGETVTKTVQGAGVCVGTRFPAISWKIIEITDAPIVCLEDARELPVGEIGEIVVTGPQVTTYYVNRPEANSAAKILDTEKRVWHRMGDVGYLDQQDRFWFCGRKVHRVTTPEKTLFSIPCEAIFNQHPKIFRSALAGKVPRIFVEPFPEFFPKNKTEKQKLITELLELAQKNPLTESIKEIRILRHFPVDVRHNVKINRELLTTYK
ncbi:MAG: AMP-binding protein [Planctomycetaceae bacterium]|jgi:acyl-CoA synthetase (AMP-forming)/AMP-acid ligase II|nr:AMP-binding protein [Planctomycetaceae bacterium]